MRRYGMDYDRGWGEYHQPQRTSWRTRGAGYTGFGGGYTGSRAGYTGGGYGREYSTYGLGYGRDYTERDYTGRDYFGRGLGYGREFRKSRWQTDYGDPFNDRSRGTPIRMMRGEWHGYGRDYFGGRRGMGYGREYRRGWGY